MLSHQGFSQMPIFYTKSCYRNANNVFTDITIMSLVTNGL